MRGLKKFREDTNASTWLLAKFSGLQVDNYMKYEKMKDENIPISVKQRLENLMKCPEMIRDYYSKAEEFYKNNDIEEIIRKSNQSLDSIAGLLGIGLNDITSLIDNKDLFPDENTKDMLVDLAMWIDSENQKSIQQSEPEEVEEPQKLIENVQVPILPEEQIIQNNIEGNNEEDLNRLCEQIEWYESLLNCFIHLSELAYKNK